MAQSNTRSKNIKRRTGKTQKPIFLCGSIQSILIWPTVCIFLACLLWGVLLSKISTEKAALKEYAFKHASSLAKTYADQLARSVEQLDQITLSLKYYWQETRGTIKLEKQTQAGLYPKSSLIYVSIVDRYGDQVTSTFDKRVSLNLANRESFQAYKTGRQNGLLISVPELSPRIGKPVIRFTRSLELADGSFDGMVSVTVELPYLASFTDESTLGKSDAFAVRRSDGPLLAIKMGEGLRSLSTIYRIPRAYDSEKAVIREPGEKFFDDLPRLVAWQKVQNYPLVAIVALSEQEIFASHEEKARDYHHLAVAGSLLLAFLAVIGVFYSSRLAWRKQQAYEVKNAYRLATDSAREGFYMVRPVYDQAGYIADFMVEDCNERGAAYYGTTKAKLVGARFSDFSSGDYLGQVLAIFRRAMETGFYEDEFKVAGDSPLLPTWIHRRLVRSGAGLAVTLRDISDTKVHEEALSRLANADAVTGLPNRHWVMNYLPLAIKQAESSDSVLALLFVDLDDFKNINDTLGHATGDELLRAVAARLKSVIRPQDNVVRLGGDEFTIILEQVDSGSDTSRVADRIIKSLAQPFVLSGESSHVVHASIGISMFPQDGRDGETLLKHADIAMYAAKANGKGHYQFYQPHLSEKLLARLNKERALRRAIERDEFELYYQPRVDTFSGELRGMEALVRWTHPELGMVSPQEFIPMAEETGLIVGLGELVIGKVCAQLAHWKLHMLPLVPISVNVSPRQFNQGNLSTFFASNMARYDIDSTLIEIEVTESCMMDEGKAAAEELAAIETLGIKLLVDDFGTGFSSLSQLQRLDLDVLKVDKAFTARLCNGKEGEAFFMAILSMAHVLGMSVVAEGVETMEQLHVLQALSCNEVQGYLVSRPVPAADVPALMRKRFLLPAALQPECSA
jgi:diguanylate cyclase (GGDEF)-like protein